MYVCIYVYVVRGYICRGKKEKKKGVERRGLGENGAGRDGLNEIRSDREGLDKAFHDVFGLGLRRYCTVCITFRLLRWVLVCGRTVVRGGLVDE